MCRQGPSCIHFNPSIWQPLTDKSPYFNQMITKLAPYCHHFFITQTSAGHHLLLRPFIQRPSRISSQGWRNPMWLGHGGDVSSSLWRQQKVWQAKLACATGQSPKMQTIYYTPQKNTWHIYHFLILVIFLLLCLLPLTLLYLLPASWQSRRFLPALARNLRPAPGRWGSTWFWGWCHVTIDTPT